MHLALCAATPIIRRSMRLPRTALATALVLTLAAATTSTRTAHADETGSGTPGAGAKPSAAPDTAISDEAKRHFAAGVSLLQDPEGEKVEEAYREFRTAYDLSGSPKVLGNMGFCAMRLERDGEAIDAYSRYLREVKDIDADERAQIVRDLQTLSVGVVRLTLEVNKPGVRFSDVRIPVRGERITNTYGPAEGKLDIGVRPGHHIITAKLAGHEDVVWELDAFAASRDKNAFVMKERVVAAGPAGESRSNVGPFVVMGIGGAMLIGGAVTGIVALGKTGDIEDRCPENVCPRGYDLDDERSSAKTFVRVTDVLLIGGAVVTLAGLGWMILGSSGDKAPAKTGALPPRARPLPLPSAGCGPDGCRASLKVVF